jgi:hypothetical protein
MILKTLGKCELLLGVNHQKERYDRFLTAALPLFKMGGLGPWGCLIG